MSDKANLDALRQRLKTHFSVYTRLPLPLLAVYSELIRSAVRWNNITINGRSYGIRTLCLGIEGSLRLP
jgi:hypothetical protein